LVADGELMLEGRGDQLAVIDRLLEGTRLGPAGVLLLRGEAAIGKDGFGRAASMTRGRSTARSGHRMHANVIARNWPAGLT
jgi:hypothetical protein